MILKVISAEEVVFEGEVVSVTLPGEKGAFTVLNNHASLISTLVAGKIVYRISDSDVSDDHGHDIEGGVVSVDDNVVSVCLY